MQRRDERKKFDLERKDKYKLVAIEKRLEAHQQAYFLWDKLIHVIHERDDEKRNKTMAEAREFWLQNNLYLETKTRNDFIVTINCVSMHPMFLETLRQAEQGDEKKKASKDVKENWVFIQKLGITIQKDVELEPITLKQDSSPEGKKLGEE